MRRRIHVEEEDTCFHGSNLAHVCLPQRQNQLCFKEPTLFFLSLKKKKKNGLSPIKKDGLSPLKEEPTVCFPFLKTKRKDQLPVFPF